MYTYTDKTSNVMYLSFSLSLPLSLSPPPLSLGACVYTYIYTYVCTYVHARTSVIHVPSYVYTSVVLYLSVWVGVVRLYIHIYVRTYVRTHTHTHTHFNYACAFVSIYMYTYTHIRINTVHIPEMWGFVRFVEDACEAKTAADSRENWQQRKLLMCAHWLIPDFMAAHNGRLPTGMYLHIIRKYICKCLHM
jgi:hypothetical protein